MATNTKFYKAVIDQITPKLFGINDDITQRSLKNVIQERIQFNSCFIAKDNQPINQANLCFY